MNQKTATTKTIVATPQKAVIYCRVSTPGQVEDGNGLDSQEARCRDYAQRVNYEIIGVFHEKGISSGLFDRPDFKKMITFLRQCEEDKIMVLIDDINRFSGDVQVHWDLKSQLAMAGGLLESPTMKFGDSPDDKLIENLLASVAQHRREKIAETTKNRMKGRALNGYWCFAAPFGYKYENVEGHGNLLVRDEPLASVIQEALEGFASGRFDTQAEVKRFLEAQPAYTDRRKNGVTFEDVLRLLTRQHYAGYIEFPDWGISLRKGHHEALIDLETYQRIQERIKEGARVPARADINAEFPLRGFVTCGDCDKPLTACWSKSKTGKKHPYYLCFNKGCESYRKSIRRDAVEGEFETILKRMQPTETLFNYVRVIFKGEWNKRLSQMQDIKKALRRDILKIDKQVEGLMDRIVDAQSGAAITAYERRIGKLEKDKLIKAEKLAEPTAPHRGFEEMFELALTFLASPWKLWASERLEDKRTVLKLAFEDRLPYCRKEGFRTPQASEPFRFLGLCGQNQEMAERQGFEPWVRKAHNGFRDRPVRPLRHLSASTFRCANSCAVSVVCPKRRYR